MAAEVGLPCDIKRSAALIMGNNPLGGICGLVCPDKHCMAECSHKLFDSPVKIPEVQATIVKKAKDIVYKSSLKKKLQHIITTPQDFVKLKKDNPVFYKEISSGIVVHEEKK